MPKIEGTVEVEPSQGPGKATCTESVPGIAVPIEPKPAPSPEAAQRSRWLLGGVLIAIGSWWIIRNVVDELAPWLDDVLLPMALIAIGTGVVVYALKK